MAIKKGRPGTKVRKMTARKKTAKRAAKRADTCGVGKRRLRRKAKRKTGKK